MNFLYLEIKNAKKKSFENTYLLHHLVKVFKFSNEESLNRNGKILTIIKR